MWFHLEIVLISDSDRIAAWSSTNNIALADPLEGLSGVEL